MISDEKIADRIVYFINDILYKVNDHKIYNLLNDIKKHYVKYLRINNVMNNNWYKIKRGFFSEFFYKKKDSDDKLLNKVYQELSRCFDIINQNNNSIIADILLSDINIIQIYKSKLK